MSATVLAEEGMEMEGASGRRNDRGDGRWPFGKDSGFFGVVCDLNCSDIPRPEPPDSCRLITSSLLPKKQAQRVAGEGCAIVCSKIV